MHLSLETIGIIKKVANKSEILIYSDFEPVIRNIVSKIGEGAEKGQKLLVIHKNSNMKQVDGHQVQVTKTTLLERNGNLLTVSKIEASEDSVIDVRLDLTA
jgi:UDP-N-acetylglucosamine transferase subunit ALG13